ncbi:MAG: diphosphomevalonate decarboxylase [Bdellovibrionota bacterium]
MAEKVTAIANVNFALSKYWGKRDLKLMLPSVTSVSLTVDNLLTKTTLELTAGPADEITINQQLLDLKSAEYLNYIGRFLDLVREIAGSDHKIKMQTENNFPTGAGLASSASGFAALTLALNQIFELKLGIKDLSILARRGSGSATRSILGGFNSWEKGQAEDGSDSHILSIADGSYWPEFRIVVCITDSMRKKVNSRAGMSQTVKTSRIYNQLWIHQAEADAKLIKQSILDKEIEKLGILAEKNAQLMHATMLETTPPIIYWNETSFEIVSALIQAREQGLQAYYTMDAGPQVKIICLESSLEAVKTLVNQVEGVKEIRVCSPALRDAYLTDSHLF